MADPEEVRAALLDAILKQAPTQSATNLLALAQAYALLSGANEAPLTSRLELPAESPASER